MVSRRDRHAPTEPGHLDGWDPAWSRFVTTPDHTGLDRRWHVLDTGPDDARLTILAVHGNPTWSYTWRHLAAAIPDDVRLIAPDQLDMGFSERIGHVRRLADRIDDLITLTDALALEGPVVVVAHDWGGPVSLGWLQRVRARGSVTIAGLVLTNTAVHQPPEATAPTLIRAARRPWLLPRLTEQTTGFLRGMFELSHPRLARTVREGYLAPYRTAERRRAISDFVDDIPLEADHPSAPVLDDVAAGLADLHDVATLLVWGAADQVFSDLYLHDLERRLPHADVHRDPSAGHLVSEDIDTASIIVDWLTTIDQPAVITSVAPSTGPVVDLTEALRDPEISDRIAIHEMETGRRATFGELDRLVDETAAGLHEVAGVRPGDRVALMIPPGIDLATTLYGCWRLGAIPVLIDAGLGPRQMSAAMRLARPDHLIGIGRALAAAKVLRWPGTRICSSPLDSARARAVGATIDLEALRRPPEPEMVMGGRPGDADAAIVFTSGATGPSKGVRYSFERIAAQIRALVELYDIDGTDALAAAFAPFALYGPAMGITSTVPEMDVSAPATLTAEALADAITAIDATLVFASPAAITNVLATNVDRDQHGNALQMVRLLLSAGAPVHRDLLAEAVTTTFPNAEAHTPYGMTECLPVADIALTDLDELAGHPLERIGVCVGRPAPGVDVAVDPLDDAGHPIGHGDADSETLGEVWVRAPHQHLGYERRWYTTHQATPAPGWHGTGDLGALDADGRLWIGGRLDHVIVTADGLVAPAAIERVADRCDWIQRSAAVGVGPRGAQLVVVVAETADGGRRPRQSTIGRIDEVRTAVAERTDTDVAACLEVSELPVDRRHNSKIDRSRVAAWAEQVLSGGAASLP